MQVGVSANLVVEGGINPCLCFEPFELTFEFIVVAPELLNAPVTCVRSSQCVANVQQDLREDTDIMAFSCLALIISRLVIES